MSRNPHIAAWRLRTRHRLVADGPGPAIARVLGPAVAVALLVPLVRPVFLRFLDLGPDVLAAGVEGVALRVGLLVVSVLSIDVYGALVRGPDRAVLDLLPVDEADVAVAQVVEVAARRAWFVVAAAAITAPIALSTPAGWGAIVVVAAGSYTLGLAASAMVHLLAVDAATSERWAPLLDALRGHNPRPQAAFLYAPGVALAGAGALVIGASGGAAAVVAGDGVGALALALPFAGAVPCALAVPGLARRSWFRASAVLSDIDARYASLEKPEEATRVYLDWSIRFLPRSVAVWALKDLRNGWRAHRTWISGAWLLGFAAALVGWIGDAGAPARAAVAVAAAVWVVAAVGVILDRDEPELLRVWLAGGGAPRRAARSAVVLGWLQACVWPAVAAVAVRHGAVDAALVLGTGAVACFGATLLGLAASTARVRGLVVYGPVAAIAVGLTAAAVGSAP